MNPETDEVDRLRRVGQRLQSALKQEAAYWQSREPAGLGQRCRAVLEEERSAVPALPPWLIGATIAAAAVLAIGVLIIGPRRRVESADAPAIVATLTDTSALYAALPRIPPLSRPPVPVRLVADRVIVMPLSALKQAAEGSTLRNPVRVSSPDSYPPGAD